MAVFDDNIIQSVASVLKKLAWMLILAVTLGVPILIQILGSTVGAICSYFAFLLAIGLVTFSLLPGDPTIALGIVLAFASVFSNTMRQA